MFDIRQEQRQDYAAVRRVVDEAFLTAEHSDGNEGELVEKLRRSPSFIPELSLVAVCDGQIAGHILFTRAQVGQTEVLALAPLAVLPKFQRRGIGLELIRRGHEIAQRLGFKFCVVLGDARYYAKTGYVPASRYGISAPFAVPDENFMAICFDPAAGVLDGRMAYDEAFGIGASGQAAHKKGENGYGNQKG